MNSEKCDLKGGTKLKTQVGPEMSRTENVQIFSINMVVLSIFISKEVRVFFLESEPLGVQLCLLLTSQEPEKLDW